VILITGGLGFIGLHTARALLDEGQEVVLTRYRVGRNPDFLRDEIGTRAFVCPLDVTDPAGWDAIGEQYEIDEIIHLAVPGVAALGPLEDYRTNMTGLYELLRAAERLSLRRLLVASSIVVYTGIREYPLREDMGLPPLVSANPTEAYKKAFETLAAHVADRLGIECVLMRIGGIYGPLYHSMYNLASRLVHAAVHGRALEFPRGVPYALDGSDLCYVRDCGRAIAALALAERLEHRVFNVGSGCPTTNAQLVSAVAAAVPGFALELQPGFDPAGPRAAGWLDLGRLSAATGYVPRYDVDAAIADYVAWLQAGNPE